MFLVVALAPGRIDEHQIGVSLRHQGTCVTSDKLYTIGNAIERRVVSGHREATWVDLDGDDRTARAREANRVATRSSAGIDDAEAADALPQRKRKSLGRE